MKKLLLLICFVFISFYANAQVHTLRFGQSTGAMRLVFEMDRKVDYKAFLLKQPDRLVVDLYNATFKKNILANLDKNALATNPRVSTDGKRIAFDLTSPVVIKKHFVLSPQSNLPWRLVIDVEAKNVSQSSMDGYSPKVKNSHKKKIIVLDAGHGGKDPGAIGHSGTYEKNITLTFVKELKQALDATGKYTVYLTRSTDRYITLRGRVNIAREKHADLFISVHADSARNKKAKGLSVYTLSETASDKEAQALAEKENKSDVVYGLDLNEHTKEVSDILINLAQRESMNKSAEFATFLVNEMARKVLLVSNSHRFAGFAVLKAPDIPAVLLELGYLSNAQEEKQLKTKWYRQKLVDSTVKSINSFFK
ncbi:MAG: N-acetylmuramoyl-L-alanine amidase [Alphaproteobacteria bacterium]